MPISLNIPINIPTLNDLIDPTCLFAGIGENISMIEVITNFLNNIPYSLPIDPSLLGVDTLVYDSLLFNELDVNYNWIVKIFNDERIRGFSCKWDKLFQVYVVNRLIQYIFIDFMSGTYGNPYDITSDICPSIKEYASIIKDICTKWGLDKTTFNCLLCNPIIKEQFKTIFDNITPIIEGTIPQQPN